MDFVEKEIEVMTQMSFDSLKPDIDNIVKIILDGLNKFAYTLEYAQNREADFIKEKIRLMRRQNNERKRRRMRILWTGGT